jgi:hypothetical protein
MGKCGCTSEVGLGSWVLVAVAALVGVRLGTGLVVQVGVLTSVEVADGVFVRVDVEPGGTVGVRVLVDEVELVVTTSCGAFPPDSLLARLIAVLPEVVSARLMSPLPLTWLVISNSFQVAALTAPVVAKTLPTAGAFE